MGLFSKLWRQKWIVRAFFPSLIFNFRHLPFKQACKLPILLYKAKFGFCGGSFIFNCHVKFGLVKLGRNTVSIYPNSGISLENRGKIIFNGKLTIGNASAISVGRTGILEFGDNVAATTSLKLACYNSIHFHDNVLIGWDCLMTDTDFHKLKYVNRGGIPKGMERLLLATTHGLRMDASCIKTLPYLHSA